METATGEVTVLNSAKLIDAKASKFEYFQVPSSLAIAANDEAEMAMAA